MINHVVLFKFKDFPSNEKLEKLTHFKNILLELPSYIPELKHIEVGLHHELNGASYDVCLISHFESIEDLNIYQNHPEHLKVVAFAKEMIAERAAVDFNF